MRIYKYITVILLSLIIVPSYAEDSPKDSCRKAAKLYEEQDLSGAIEEAQWCLDLLKQELASQVSSIFPDSINGFEGGELESQNAMGFSSTKRIYSKDEKQITVSLTGNTGGVMDAFSSLAQLGMSASMGQKMRIQKRTAMLMTEGNGKKIMVTLKEGGMLMFESSKLSKDEIVAFANAFPVAELDDSRG